MQKLVLVFRFESVLLLSLSRYCHSNPSRSLLSVISSSFTVSQNRACSSNPDWNVKSPVLADYLIGSLKFSEHRALSISSRFSRTKSLQKPEEAVHFFKGLCFSEAHIQSIAQGAPQVLFADVEKTLKPKVTFFEELGLSGPRLRSLLSRSPGILRCSLERTLKPCIHLVSEVLKSDGRYRTKEQVSDDLLRILTGSNRILHMKSRLEVNIPYLESCGVVGSQLSSLLLRKTRTLYMQKDKLAEVVSRALDMNFTLGSRMLVHAIHSLSGLSPKALNGRFEVFMMFGFSKDEIASMFRKSPHVFGLSQAKLRFRIEFFLNDLKVDKLMLVQHPVLLAYSLEERIIPRYNVLETLKSRRLLSKDSSFIRAIFLPNQQFLENYIFRFKDDAEDLLLAYNRKLIDTS